MPKNIYIFSNELFAFDYLKLFLVLCIASSKDIWTFLFMFDSKFIFLQKICQKKFALIGHNYSFRRNNSFKFATKLL